MGGRFDRDEARANARELYLRYAPRLPCVPCPHCGSTEPHFIPPSMGERGFYACEIVAHKPEEPKPCKP